MQSKNTGQKEPLKQGWQLNFTLSAARQIAKKNGHKKLGTLHFLLAMLDGNNTGEFIIDRILTCHGKNVDQLLIALDYLYERRGSDKTKNVPPLTQTARRVLQFAEEEARSLGGNTAQVGNDHLLLALTLGEDRIARALMRFGVSTSAVAEEMGYLGILNFADEPHA
ncbi:MAG: chaperone protein ClpC, chloroplastic-like [Parcubacteria group bacterium]|nr:chaperone protein ClpC, chloroplastic-like [Parcubacteria group bacterium]